MLGLADLSDSVLGGPLATAGGAVILAALGTAALVWGRGHLKGTTLLPAWWWTLVALWVVAGVQVTRSSSGNTSTGTWYEALRYSAAVATFCPTMAALGAKRPQDKAWQFIVVSLWGILVLPAAEMVFLHPGEALQIRGARSWFLLVLIFVGIANTLPTRFWLSSLLVAAGQTVLLLDYLPLGLSGWNGNGVLPGLALFVFALGLTSISFSPRRVAHAPLDRLWLDFRDLFGTLWGLRVAERVNASAALYKWSVVLSWSGFRATDGSSTPVELSAEQFAAVRQCLDNLLRRFVSPEWIDARLGDTLENP